MSEPKIKEVHGLPPNFERIARVFPEARREGVIFTYGTTVYVTGPRNLTRELRAHESVHATRQLATEGGPDAWWERYLTEPQFRLDEELHAHRAEWLAYRKRHGPSATFLNTIADRLASPLYGKMLTLGQAKHAILTGAI